MCCARQELEFTDYHEVSLVNGNMHYYQREPKVHVHAAERIHDFDELWQVSIPPESDVGAISSTKVNGVQALCFAMQPDKFTRLRYCFDAATHLLLSRKNDEKAILLKLCFWITRKWMACIFPELFAS